MEIKWSFVIDGNRNRIQNLIHYLDYDDLIFYEEGDEESDLTYYFSSVHLNHLSQPIQIDNTAQQLLALLNAIDLIIQEDKQNHIPITLDRLIDIKNKSVLFYKKSVPPHTFQVNFNINPTSKPQHENYITRIFEIAKGDDFVINLLYILSDGMTFVTLYQAFDEIKSFLGTKNDNVANLGFSKSVTGNFTHTANNFQALGKQARHGSTGNMPPLNPMELDEAQRLVSDIIREIFRKYYNEELPVHKAIKIDPNDLF